MEILSKNNHVYTEFEESLDNDDFGFILDKEGRLKGMWIPEGHDDDPIPAAVVEVIRTLFDIDVNDEDNYGTVH